MKPLTDRQAEILSLLVARPLYGLEIAERWEEEHDGKRFPIGGLYTTMDRMTESGLVRAWMGESTAERGGNRRKYFEITAGGREALEAHSEHAAKRVGLLQSLLGRLGTPPTTTQD